MVDHGIEPEDERIEKTKPGQGTIKVVFQLNEDNFEIFLQDDGQGSIKAKLKRRPSKKALRPEKKFPS